MALSDTRLRSTEMLRTRIRRDWLNLYVFAWPDMCPRHGNVPVVPVYPHNYLRRGETYVFCLTADSRSV